MRVRRDRRAGVEIPMGEGHAGRGENAPPPAGQLFVDRNVAGVEERHGSPPLDSYPIRTRGRNGGTHAMLSRRELALCGAAAIAVAPLVARAQASHDARLAALLDAFFQENLRASPESATQIGLDTGANADLKSRLRDESPAGIAAARALNADQLRRLTALD